MPPALAPLAGTAAWIAVSVTCLKLLLVPAYHSTDFEVHRNWLAITASLPLAQWYTDETSPWTLDYPPFFAWFERVLALVGTRVDPTMTQLHKGLNHAGPATVLFQRLTVMASDLLLVYAAYRYSRQLDTAPSAEGRAGWGQQSGSLVLGCVVLLPGLLIVDHIHFQYNGMLLGALVLCVALLREGRDWEAGLVFAVLCCTKHLFAVAGPWFAVFLFRAHCLGNSAAPGQVLWRAAKLGITVLVVLLLAFGPFAAMGQMSQVLGRLFPFGRGLCHAYWAPNAWALYNVADKAALAIASRLPLPPSLAATVAAAKHASPAFTRGLVGQGSGSHALLPQVTPGMSLLLVLLAMLPCLVHVWLRPSWHRRHAATSLAYIFLCAFVFGWHVHEKAALHFVLLLALTAADGSSQNRDFLYISTVVHYSLFPLLFGIAEYPSKLLMLLLYLGGLWAVSRPAYATPGGHKIATDAKGAWRGNCSTWHMFCLVHGFGLLAVEAYNQILHPLLFKAKLEFLPLMLMSVYCSVGICAFSMRQAWLILTSKSQTL